MGGLKTQDTWYHQLISDDIPTCDNLAESYNNFLVGLTSQFSPLVPCDEVDYLEIPQQLLVNIGQVHTALRQTKTSKSPGSDMIPNRILKDFAFELAPIIADIYNSSLTQGISPPHQLKLYCETNTKADASDVY